MPNRSTRLDWIDALLFAFGFAGVIAGATVLGTMLHVDVGRGAIRAASIALGFGPMALRRAIFGAPKLPPPREGALWSLLSIVALFAVLFGVGTFVVATMMLGAALASPPDFDARARELLSSGPAFSVSVIDPSETPAARAEREAREAAEAAAEREREIASLVAIDRASWEQQHGSAIRSGTTLSAAGALLLAIGAVLLKLRYPREHTA